MSWPHFNLLDFFFLDIQHANWDNPRTGQNHPNVLNSPIQDRVSRMKGFYQVNQVWLEPWLSSIKNWSIDLPSFEGAYEDLHINSLRARTRLEMKKLWSKLRKIAQHFWKYFRQQTFWSRLCSQNLPGLYRSGPKSKLLFKLRKIA